MRLEVLVCLAKLLEYLDKWSVMDDVLTFLTDIRSREPKILVAVLGKSTHPSPMLLLNLFNRFRRWSFLMSLQQSTG